VALHRVAFLAFDDPALDGPDTLVVLFSRALQRFVGRVLPSLGLERVRVESYREWAAGERRRHLPALPTRQREDAPSVVQRVKLHPFLAAALERHVAARPAQASWRQVVDDWASLMIDGEALLEAAEKQAPGLFSEPDLRRFVLDQHAHVERVLAVVAGEVEPDAELDPEDDFLEEETTKVHEHFVSAFPADADATVVAAEAALPFASEKRLTPVVVSPNSPRSPLESEVPDLFGPGIADSFGPAPGEFIDASLLDPGVVTVPPPANKVPEAPGIPAEAFKVSQATEPVWTTRPTPPKKEVSRGWTGLVVLAVLVAGGAVAVWQLGFADDLVDLAEGYLGRSEELARAPQRAAAPVAAADEQPLPSTAAPAPVDDASAASDTAAVPNEKPNPEAKASAATSAMEAAEPVMVRFEVTSRPTGAFVSVNGTGAGRTPLDLEYPAGTELTIFSKARGYLARRQQITVRAKQEPVSLVLAPLPYVIEVVSSPAGATASSSGVGQVVTPGSLRFKSMPASRTVVISKDGFKTTTQTVALDDFTEETRRLVATVDVTLQKSASAEPAPGVPAAQPVSPQPAPPARSAVDAEAAPETAPMAKEPVQPPPRAEGAPAPSAEPDAP